MGDNFWEATQAILQGNPPMVVKPKLTEALLKKPPFRFLHDVISQVQTNKKFAQGLFAGDELDSASIKDKAAKVSYLTKIIDVVGIASGNFVPAKPLKVVAGHEPELTNQFLQMLGEIANKTDAADAVQRVLAGEHQTEGGAAKSEAPPPQPPTSEAPLPASEPDPETPMPPSSIGISEPSAPKEEPPKEEPRAEDKPKKDRRSSRNDAPKAEKPPPKPAPEPEPEPERQEVVRAAGGAPQRPQSARRGPPKPVVKETPKEKLSGGMAPPGAAGRPPTGPSAPVRGIMADGDDGDDDDDDEQLVVQSDRGGTESFTTKGNEGKLVRDILDTKDELNKGQMQEEEQREEKETGIILGRGRKKGADTVKKEEVFGILVHSLVAEEELS